MSEEKSLGKPEEENQQVKEVGKGLFIDRLEDEYKLMGWEKFKPIPHSPKSGDGAGKDAWTFISIDTNKPELKIDENVEKDTAAYVVDYIQGIIRINLEKSWVVTKEKKPALLTHEQGHYHIWYIMLIDRLRKIQALKVKVPVPPSKITSSNIKSITGKCQKLIDEKIQRIKEESLSEISRLNNLYDKQTNHGTNSNQQNAWNLILAKHLESGLPLEQK